MRWALMQFEVIRKGQTVHTYTKNVIYLYEDRWNDWFHYITMFRLVYIDENGKAHELGSSKFGQFNMTYEQTSPHLPNEFTSLSKDFFSLGQSEEYYENIKLLNQGEHREEILASLNDLAFNLQLFNQAYPEQVTQQSLLRDVSVNTVKEQYHRIAMGGAKLTPFDIIYTLPKQTNTNLQIEFHVRPNFYPPTNVHVIIGRNGVGKTHLFQSMIHCLTRGNIDNEYGTFSLESESKLANFVCVAFSPFDMYPIPEQLADNTQYKDKYIYIGLSDLNTFAEEGLPEYLAQKFRVAFTTCSLYKERRLLWTDVISLLDSDPIFQRNGISALFSEELPEDIDRISYACSLFNRLSSGHKVILLTLTSLIVSTAERTLVLIDEPENHLHPPLLSAFIRALSELLTRKNGLAIIATHSPVILQEVPRSCVQRLSRVNNVIKIEKAEIETFGESIQTLTNEVFGLEVTHSGFHKLLLDAVEQELDYEQSLDFFHSELGTEARAILRLLLAEKNKNGEDVP